MVELNATLIAQIINFLLLLAILTKLAWKPLIKALDERKARIAADIESAERDKAAAAKARREYEEQLARARADAQAIINKAIQVAEKSKEEIIEAARAEHARLLEHARNQIALEREQVVAELRKEVILLSMAAASKIIEQNLNNEVNAKMVEDFINKLDKQKIGDLLC